MSARELPRELPRREQDALYKRRVRDGFNRAADTYAQHTDMQRAMARRLAAMAPAPAHKDADAPLCILDVGSGLGYLGAELTRADTEGMKDAPPPRLVNLDISIGMLRAATRDADTARGVSVCADMECLPFATGSFDWVASCATLHWSADYAALFAEMRRVMRGGGCLLFATMAAGTLSEVAQCWSHVDRASDARHILRFPTADELRTCAEQSGFAIDFMHEQHETLIYDSVAALFNALKKTGGAYRPRETSAQSRRGLTPRKQLDEVSRLYAERFNWRGKPYANYEVIFCRARPTT